MEELQNGAVLEGRYVIGEVIGRGGMGVVYLARDKKLGGRRVAIKTISEMTADSVARFEGEAIAAASIDSPYVVRVYDFWVSAEGVPYLAMELLTGRNLKKRLEGGALDIGSAVDAVLGACHAVVEAHACGILHRDLSLDNIFVLDGPGTERVKVLDFGLSLSSDASRLTGKGQVVGTLQFVAPERVEGKEGDPRSDQYSLGVVLYRAVTGRPAFDRLLKTSELLLAIARGNVPRAHMLVESLDRQVSEIIARAMSVDPSGRFASVHEFGRALLPFATDVGRVLHSEYFTREAPANKVEATMSGVATAPLRVLRVRDVTSISQEARRFLAGRAGVEGLELSDMQKAGTVPVSFEAVTVPHDYAELIQRVQVRRAGGGEGAPKASTEQQSRGEAPGRLGEAESRRGSTTVEAGPPEGMESEVSGRTVEPAPAAALAPRRPRSHGPVVIGGIITAALAIAGVVVVTGRKPDEPVPTLELRPLPRSAAKVSTADAAPAPMPAAAEAPSGNHQGEALGASLPVVAPALTQPPTSRRPISKHTPPRKQPRAGGPAQEGQKVEYQPDGVVIGR
jgi:hypothetical protein